MRQGPKKVRVIDIDKPKLKPDEVLIKVACVGICGSDIHRLEEDNVKWDSVVLGHEFSGVVTEIGSAVKNVKVGQRAAVAPLVPCHSCEYCVQGQFSQCPNYSFIGSRRNGAFAEYTAVPAINLIPIPDSLSMERAALLEPLTVVLHPLMMLDNQLGRLDTVVVTGLGAIGLLAVQVLKHMGARNIVVSDIIPEKLELAKELGATHAVNVRDQKLEDTTDKLGGANLVFESSGSNPAKQSAIRVAHSKGVILLVGTSPRDITFEAALFERITRKELCILGSWMNYSAPWPGKEWETAAWLVDKGHIDDKKIITHHFKLEDCQRAVDIVTGNGEPFIKIVFNQE